MRGKADNRVVRQLPYSFRLTKQKFKAQRKKIQKRGPDSGPFFCSPLFQHSLGNTLHGAKFGAEKRPKKRGWKSALKTAFFANNMDEKLVTRRASPSSSPKTMWSRAYSFPTGNPQVCQMLRIHCLRCHHTFRFPQCCPAINAIIRIIKVVEIFGLCFAPIANLRQQTRQTSISFFWFEYTVHFMH